jgi:hypothetical protein
MNEALKDINDPSWAGSARSEITPPDRLSDSLTCAHRMIALTYSDLRENEHGAGFNGASTYDQLFLPILVERAVSPLLHTANPLHGVRRGAGLATLS